MPGSPGNHYLSLSETQAFTTDHIEVRNGLGDRKLSINGFYRIPPHTAYTIKKYIIEVGNRATFVSMTPKKYDLSLAWTIQNQVNIKLVHDTGFDNALEMVSVDTTQGGNPATYSIAR